MTCDLQAIRERLDGVWHHVAPQTHKDARTLLAMVDRANDALHKLGRISSAHEANEARLRAAIEQHRDVKRPVLATDQLDPCDRRLWASLDADVEEP